MLYPISTHAPRTGSDDKAKTVFSPENLFQPTLPARGATSGRGRGDPPAGHFNPRSPHGERRHRETHRQHHKEISTHAPRTGSDDAPARFLVGIQISTHAPRTGSDGHAPSPDPNNYISTHAPRTGSDSIARQAAATRWNFNPRSPHGERPPLTSAQCRGLSFQPTLPARGATTGESCL